MSASNVASGNGNCSARPNTRSHSSRLPAAGHVGRPFQQHLGSEVDSSHPGTSAGRELESYSGRAGGHVEHRRRAPRDHSVDHGAAPPAVLAEGQSFGEAVVPGREAIEQLLREAVPPAAEHVVRLGYWHAAPLLARRLHVEHMAL